MSYKSSGMFGEDSPLPAAVGVIGVVLVGASLVKMGYEFGCSYAKKTLKLHKQNTKELEKRKEEFYREQEKKERQREREWRRERKKLGL